MSTSISVPAQANGQAPAAAPPAAVGRSAGLLPHEYYLSLARRLRVQCGTPEPQAVGVTSCQPRAGVTSVAANLALGLARLESQPVLLVDAAGGPHGLPRRLGAAGGPGLRELLAGQVSPGECIQRTAAAGLSVLPAGDEPLATAEFDLGKLAGLIDRLKTEYGLVVWDLPPVHELTISLAVAAVLDGTLLVLESGKVPAELLRRVREQLSAVRSRLLGVVLNK